MADEKKWEVVVYSQGSEKNIVGFTQDDMKALGNETIYNKAFWKWKYKNNNAGFFPGWILLAKAKEHVVGHYAVMPININFFNKILLCAQAVDARTHRDFARQGIFTSLASACHINVQKDGVDIIYGYPNKYSYPGFVGKLGWHALFTVEELAFILNEKRVADMKLSNPLLKTLHDSLLETRRSDDEINICESEYSIKSVNKIDFDIKIIKNWLKNRYNCFIERDSEYLIWRYLKNPLNKSTIRLIYQKNKIKGLYVLKIRKYPHREDLVIGHIMEILSEPDDKNVFFFMLQDIENRCLKEDVDILHTYTHRTQHDYELLHQYGFMRFDEKHYIIRINNDFEEYEKILVEKNWYVSLGDSDRA